MRSKWYFLLLVILLLIVVRPLLAADATGAMTPEEMRAKCIEIDAACAAAMQNVEDLQALKAVLLGELGEGAPPASVSKPSAWADKIVISGYFQNRYEHFSPGVGAGAANEDRFGMRRLYLNLLIKTGGRASGVLTFGSDGPNIRKTDTAWHNIFCDYKVTDTDTLRFGQGPNQFGLEAWQSSGRRLPFERSAVVEGGTRGKPAGFYFLGWNDRGLWWIHTPKDRTRLPQTVVSVVNGSFLNDPLNNSRAVAVDLKWQPKWGMYGISWLNSTFTQPAAPNVVWHPRVPQGPFARNAWDGYVRYVAPNDWAVQTEFIGGRMAGNSVRGWYGQLEKVLPNAPGTAFAKYEWYDPNTNDGMSSDIYRAWILGYAHQLDKNNRITAQGTWGKIGTSTPRESGVSWQYGF